MENSWVEQIGPEDEVDVEIIYPKFYVDYNMATLKKFARGISYLCKGAAILGEDETEFLVWGITVLQTQILEDTFSKFGIILEHEHGKLDGERWTYFYADLNGLKERLKDEGLELM